VDFLQGVADAHEQGDEFDGRSFLGEGELGDGLFEGHAADEFGDQVRLFGGDAVVGRGECELFEGC
jgi:hypothetical protein